jgi:glycosyltransferase involved in cell wall biosynthesis
VSVDSEPLVSVVTPVFNGASYLRECIESVLAQIYSNWEYVILNNCSTDETLKIAEEYARKDKRIRVHCNEKLLDIIANHNKAFGLISKNSKYCKVVSADDWLFPECLTRMVGVAEANPSVGLVGSYQLSGGGPDWSRWKVRWTQIPYPSTVVASRQICRLQMLGGEYVFGTPTSLLYRADLVRVDDHFYPNSTAEADTSACYKCLSGSDFGFVHQVLSYERIHGKQMSEESRTLWAYFASWLSDLLNYGSNWLTAEEIHKRREEILEDYYEFLAAKLFQRTDRAFWEYHEKRLNEVGLPLSKARLAKALFAKLLDLLFNPKQTFEKVLARVLARQRFGRVGTESGSFLA